MFQPTVERHAPFRDRTEAGRALASALGMFETAAGAVVLGLPRGGMPVARAVADALGAPLEAVVARKIGVPGIEEVALGAIAEGHDAIVTESVAWYIGVPTRVLGRLAVPARVELERRVRLYRDARPLPDVRGRVVVLVDDGIATGATLRAAARAIRARRPARLVAAAPVGTLAGVDAVARDVDEVVVLNTLPPGHTVSAAYADFAPVSDAAVMRLLGRPVLEPRSPILRDVTARIAAAPPHAPAEHAPRERRVEIAVGLDTVVGDLGMPRRTSDPRSAPHADEPRGLAILAHGGGSSRDSYRNRYLAGRLRLAGYATLRLDLLTPAEQARDARDGVLRFDVSRLAARIAAACGWAASNHVRGAARTVVIGASTGAAAALCAAADHRAPIAGVVARGGRVQLASAILPHVATPVLLIVGDADRETLAENEDALRRLPRGARLVRVRGAGHTFEQPGALGAVAEHTVAWLDRRFS